VKVIKLRVSELSLALFCVAPTRSCEEQKGQQKLHILLILILI